MNKPNPYHNPSTRNVRKSISLFDTFKDGDYYYCNTCGNLTDYNHINKDVRKDDQVGKKGHEFNLWMRNHLPGTSTGLILTDIDMFIMNYKTMKFMMIEIKTGWNPETAVKQNGQYKILAYLDSCIKSAKQRDFEYLGCHLIKCTGRHPGEGEIYWDRETTPISSNELIHRLSI